jgi:1-acyl-sn-glycerol-3-phosphate acyltransferase
MIIFKEVSLILGIFIYLATAVGIHILLFLINPSLRLRVISHWTRLFNKLLRLILRIKIIVEGRQSRLNENGNFIISNHLGYLDGVVLGSLFAVVYISKSQVKSWPLFGWMTQAAGTIFIDRRKKHKSADYISQTSKVLKSKTNVLVFPEGTSTNGERLLPFQSVHFESPLISSSSILPVSVCYTRVNDQEINPLNRDKVCWYGKMRLIEHLRDVLRLRNIEVKIIIHPKIELDSQSASFYSRKQLSESLHKIISSDYPLFQNK